MSHLVCLYERIVSVFVFTLSNSADRLRLADIMMAIFSLTCLPDQSEHSFSLTWSHSLTLYSPHLLVVIIECLHIRLTGTLQLPSTLCVLQRPFGY